MDINITYGMGGYCGVKCSAVDEFLSNEKEMVDFGTSLLDSVIELISNSENDEIAGALSLIEQAREIILNEVILVNANGKDLVRFDSVNVSLPSLISKAVLKASEEV